MFRGNGGRTRLLSVLLALAIAPAVRAGRTVSLHVNPAALSFSPHRDLACADCHAGLDPGEIPHAARIAPVDCTACHGDPADSHAFHPWMADTNGSSCTDCHGTHEILAISDPASMLTGKRQPAFCGGCHGDIAEAFARSEHGKALAGEAPGGPSCLACHRQPLTPARLEGDPAALKLAQERICLTCHLDDPEVRARMGPSGGFIAAYERSVHGAALLRGNADAATCIDCHGSHEMKKGLDPDARVSRAHIPETCASCHAEVAQRYGEGIHAAALKRGNREAPVCTDCHGEHDIMLHTDPKAPVAASNVSQQVCSPCHSSVRLSAKYGIASDRFSTFSDSYHGLAIRGGSIEAANCASCHGAHDIKPSSDPASRTHKVNLAATCGKCHPGANERFAIGDVHVDMNGGHQTVLSWISSIYIVIIVLTIGGMLVHNFLDFNRKAVRKLRIRTGVVMAHAHGKSLYLRMTVGERLQHGALMLSFIVLVITGFMLSYPEAWWVVAIRRLSDSAFEMRSFLHRAAAVVMTAASLYHIAYLALTQRGRRLLLDLLPRRRDLVEAIGTIKYNLWLSKSRPPYGRFSYAEKAEYWALVWGTIIMVGTGVIMWFENTFIGLLTKLGWDIARTIHFYEAWLAALAILVWHIYYVMVNPEVYPMNTAWLTGRMTEAEMAEDHPSELAEIRRKEAHPEQPS